MHLLDEHHRRILLFIERYHSQFGRTPSYEEIRQGTGMNSKDHVYRDVVTLEEMNYVRRERSISRGITLLRTADGYPVSTDAYSIPVLGTIDPSGTLPRPDSYVQARDWVRVTRALIPDAQDVYAIRAQGDALLDALVHDGDMIVMKKATEAENGQLVAVTGKTDPAAHLSIKRYFKRDGEVWLQPENKGLPASRWSADDVQVHGIVLCIIRKIPADGRG